MKIGIFTTDFPYKWPFVDLYKRKYFWGGVAEVTFQLALSLNKMGHKVIIFTSSIDHREEVQYYDNITIYRYPRTFRFKYTDISFQLFFKPLMHDVDIVHIQRGSPPGAVAGYIYAKVKRKDFILSYHGDPISSTDEGIKKKVIMRIFNMMLKRMLDSAKIISTLSLEFIKESIFLKNYIDKIEIIPNGIDIKEYDIPKSKYECRKYLNLPTKGKIIIFVGALTKRKGVDVLLKAMKEVANTFPDSYLVFVGDGLMKKNLENMSKTLEIDHIIRFEGFVTGIKKVMLYKSSDILVLPSFSEGFGMVLLEACACGIPIVVSDLDAVKIIVKNGHNGLFARKGDNRDFAEKIISLFRDENKMQVMSQNAKDIAKKFSWDLIANRTCETYQKLYDK